MVSISEPGAAAAASRAKRRSVLATPSSDLWISPRTQASGPRSSVAGALAAVWTGAELCIDTLSARRSGDLETRHGLTQFLGHVREFAHLLRGGPRAFARLLGHGEDVLDV